LTCHHLYFECGTSFDGDYALHESSTSIDAFWQSTDDRVLISSFFHSLTPFPGQRWVFANEHPTSLLISKGVVVTDIPDMADWWEVNENFEAIREFGDCEIRCVIEEAHTEIPTELPTNLPLTAFNVELACMDELEVCQENVEQITPNSWSLIPEGNCNTLPTEASSIISSYIGSHEVCIYDNIDQYFVLINDRIINTCVAYGLESNMLCKTSIGRFCSGRVRGESTYGTFQQQGAILQRALQQTDKIHPQCS